MCPKISLDKREYPNGGGSSNEDTSKKFQTPPSVRICNADVLSISICNAITSINPIEFA